MARKKYRRLCPSCGSPVAHDPRNEVSQMLTDLATGARVFMVWHISCADNDETFMAMIEADSQIVRGEGAEQSFTDAYVEAVKAVSSRHGSENAPKFIDVKRDMHTGEFTLRRPDRWGLVSRRNS